MTKKIIIPILLITLALNGYSQSWSRYKYEVFYGLGVTNFMSDICAPTPEASPLMQAVWVNFWNTIGYTGNAGIRYNFEDRQYLRADISMGTLFAKDPSEDPKYWDRGIIVNSFYTQISGKYEFMVWKEKKRATVYRKLGESPFKNFSMPTYLFIGVGATFNAGKFAKVSSDGKYLIDESFTNIAPIIPFGFGFKYKINRLTYINLEASWNFVLGDKVDNAKGTKNPRNEYGVWIDQYQTITFNIVHKIRANKNGMPKFSKNKRSF